MAAPATPETDAACRNCGRPAGPRYCGHCGQALAERRGPLLSLLRDVASEWFSLDGKLLRSLGALLRPGRLIRLYLSGKRAPYPGPFRLYAVASLLLFSTALDLRTPDASQVNLYVNGELVSPDIPVDELPDFNVSFTESALTR